VAKKLVDELFCRFSMPEQLHSDQGKQFESILLQEICKILDVKKTRTTPYHPQCDGLIERFNRTLLSMLATTAKHNPFSWEERLHKVCFAYNTSVHASTGHTPFYLMFGRQAKLPIDLMYPTANNSNVFVNDYAAQLKTGLEDAYKLVREKLGATHQRQKAFYDRTVHGEPYNPDDLVWLHTTVVPPGHSKKLHHPWTGPFKVIQRLSDCDYKIKGLRGKKKTHVVHFNRLKPCAPGTRFMGEMPDEPDSSEASLRTLLQDQHVIGQDLDMPDTDSLPEDPPLLEDPSLPDNPTLPASPTRYPQRGHAPPNWYGDRISY
jgi:hypothetical protein